MSHEKAVLILNALLKAEYGNLIQRLGEASPYVDWPAAADSLLGVRMLEDHRRHERELAEMILRLRGTPIPPTFPTSVGGLHFLRLEYLMPQVIAGVKGLIRSYETCGGASHPDADALLARNLDDHKRHLTELTKLHANMQPA